MSWTIWNGESLKSKMNGSILKALNTTAQQVGMQSDQEVPHDEGILQQTKTIMANPSKLEVHIGYGGGGVSGFPIVPYAVKWHETPANFQKGRKHNYLRDPVNQVAPAALKNNIKTEMNKVLR